MIRNERFYGPKISFFDLAYLENNKYFVKHYKTKYVNDVIVKNIQVSIFFY